MKMRTVMWKQLRKTKKLKNPSNNTITAFATSTIPLTITGILGTTDEFIQSYWMSALGEKAIGVDAIFDSMIDLLFETTTELLDPISSMAGEASGEKEPKKITQVTQAGWILAAMISVPSVFVLWNIEPILRHVGQPTELIPDVVPYSRAACFACPAYFWLVVDRSFLKAISKNTLLVPLSLFSITVGSGSSYLFMFGKFGLPNLGVSGVGYAIALQCWLSWAVLKLYFLKNKDIRAYKLFHFDSINIAFLKEMLRLGAPIYFLSLGKSLANSAFTMINGWFGTRYLAINHIASIYLLILKEPGYKVAQMSQVFVARFKGARDYNNMRRFGNAGIYMGIGTSLIPLAVFSTCSMQLTNLFISEEHKNNLDEYQDFIRWLFITKAVVRIFEAIQEVASENLKGLFDTYYPTIVQLVTTFALTLPLSYLVGYVCDQGLIGMNVASILGISASIPPLLSKWNALSQKLNSNLIEAPIPNTGNSAPPLTPMYHAASRKTSNANKYPSRDTKKRNTKFESY